MFAARACSNSQNSSSFCGMKIEKFVLLIPWQLSDLVQCKPLVKEFISTVVDSKKSKICTKLHLQLAFDEVDRLEEFANRGLSARPVNVQATETLVRTLVGISSRVT